ncbi:fosfomycin resistance glutathione transferase [Erwinia sp. 198]|uniref:fosfomycin resistance glutathione transferase n=1 Tax=Erwinia sp. 198 TaxID=2022746 RepID=UPI000F67832D|nr:fosfomycin resistance glutathione transferase [Erwinia sp. 198]RRZ94708.1 fosfomycin resistance glutathione transferase [Erwinia sp. 198]
MLKGLNHLTLAVTDLGVSLAFYQRLLQMEVNAVWEGGAYLSCGSLWLCLSYDPAREVLPAEKSDYTHYAFTVESSDFVAVTLRLQQAGVESWKENRSEGDSFYFLDPDGHKLEIHAGDLRQRLAACRKNPYAKMIFK